MEAKLELDSLDVFVYLESHTKTQMQRVRINDRLSFDVGLMEYELQRTFRNGDENLHLYCHIPILLNLSRPYRRTVHLNEMTLLVDTNIKQNYTKIDVTKISYANQDVGKIVYDVLKAEFKRFPHECFNEGVYIDNTRYHDIYNIMSKYGVYLNDCEAIKFYDTLENIKNIATKHLINDDIGNKMIEVITKRGW